MAARNTANKQSVMAVTPKERQEHAERLFNQKQEGTKALSEYQAKEQATRLLTAKLRAERLAREAITGKRSNRPNAKLATTGLPR
jgi:hypothetical protein